ncbi:hypothetical protein [Echinococcus multilocularis]|uniref:Uncharacterized protein n=1 Tax=Echinococcus multilocularis TaxID=6211 RepID=A0A068Y8Q1_ECHMU|nr:hypothetical protein [Echinococcus multilocularis]
MPHPCLLTVVNKVTISAFNEQKRFKIFICELYHLDKETRTGDALNFENKLLSDFLEQRRTLTPLVTTQMPRLIIYYKYAQPKSPTRNPNAGSASGSLFYDYQKRIHWPYPLCTLMSINRHLL